MGKAIITKVCAREIIDCRGWPTVQADVWVDDRLMGRADVPAGCSTGSHEAHVLLDGDEDRYRGLGVLNAISNVNDVIGPALKGWHVTDQRKIDMAMKKLDGTPNKSHLGANAILGVSLAVARAAANVRGVPLYRYINPTAHILPVPPELYKRRKTDGKRAGNPGVYHYAGRGKTLWGCASNDNRNQRIFAGSGD